MAFTGKATYDAGAALPEIAEDVSDVIGLVSPYETPLLDHLGDPRRPARSTIHEWLESSLNAAGVALNQSSFTPSATEATALLAAEAGVFRAGDQIRAAGSDEVMLVTGVNGPALTVVRGYGGSTPEALTNGVRLEVIGNAALEGADAGASRATTRTRQRNYTQIYSAAVEVSGSQLASDVIGVRDELDYQMQERLRELLRELESSVINGRAPASTPEGSDTVRRSMNGVLALLTTNVLEPGEGGLPEGGGTGSDELTEPLLNAALREIWEGSSGSVDTIVVNGAQKRRINAFADGSRGYAPEDTTFRNQIAVYESDYGVCRVVLSRWVPSDKVLLLDSTRVQVMPLSGRSFQFKRLASSGDSEIGQVVGEYTLELMNESAHGVLGGLSV